VVLLGVIRICRAGKREGQGNRGDAFDGVAVAGLEGHKSRFAVYLVHKALNLKGLELEDLGPAPCGGGLATSAERLAKKLGCYHTRSVNVL
jgi:hypothetical protein